MKRIFIILLFLPFFSKGQGTIVDSTGNIISTAFSIGTKKTTAPLTVANFATDFPAPQSGTMLHIISDNVVNGRISTDTYNNASFTGPIIQGRRARGTAASPTPPILDDIIMSMGGDGYGTSSFTGSSIGSFNIRAAGTFSNTSKPTYLSGTTTPVNSTTQVERFNVSSAGAWKFNAYGTGTFTGTPAYALQVDASGNIIEGALGGSVAWGGVTGTLSNQTDLQNALNLKANLASPTFTGSPVVPGYVPTTTTVNGQALSSNVTVSTISGNAGTATALQTSRKINGSSFDGSADITTDNDLLAYTALGSPILAQTVNQRLEYSNTSTALVDGQIKYEAVYLPKAATLTGIRVYVRTLGSYTGDNNNRIGLYTYSGGTLTLVASSINSSSLWTAAANAAQIIPFSSTYAAAAGLYFVGFIYNNSAQVTAPTLASGTALNNLVMASTAMGFTNSAKLHGTSTGTDLPSSIAMSSITASTVPSWVALY